MIKTTQALKARTATPDKYPQKRFNRKPCKRCSKHFSPIAPSHLYCSQNCAVLVTQDKYYQRNYGISREEWLAMYEAQNRVCYICQTEGFVMREGHQAKLMVDHCHETGKVRGLLCHNCNRALGLLKDDIECLKRALIYLEGATTRA
jgi:hypothetical protein